MAESGILRFGDRVELIEGEIIDRVPISSRHAAAINRISSALQLAVANRAILGIQNPIRLSHYTEPQPDIALLRLCEDFYAGAHPVPADVLLIIEVAASTLDYDRNTKLPLYSRHGIPEVWLIDLDNQQFSIHSEPQGGSYASMQPLASLQQIPVPGLEPAAIDLSGLW